MRMTCFVAAFLLFLNALPGDDKAPGPTLNDDWKALQKPSWVNDKPDAAWAKLPDAFKKQYGGMGWKRVEVRFWEDPDPLKRIPRGGSKHKVDIGFIAAGKDEAFPRWGNLSLTLQDDKGTRFFVLKGHADVEYKIQYSFKDGKLTLKGTFFSLNPALATPTIFDGEFTPVEVKKK
jgi:hypothetical protein